MAATTPETKSADYLAMEPYWTKVDTIMGGAEAMRAAGTTYLPQFPNETDTDYEHRRANAKFTNIYADIVSNLASKPFAEEVALSDDASDRFKELAQDIDGRGNNLHVFASETFFEGINKAIDWILVDYTRARPRADGRPLSIAEERSQGLRPYWVHIPATRLLAVYSDVVQGREIIVDARIRETATVRDGFGETTVRRVRHLSRAPIYEVIEGVPTDRIVGYAPATFTVYEQRATSRANRTQWVIVDSGQISIGVIALVPFITGRRKGGSWCFVPPMQDAADLQIEHYQQETALKSIKELTAFPMLAGNGVTPQTDEAGNVEMVPVGPRAVLFAPPASVENGTHGSWAFIEPSASSLKFLADDVKATEQQLRELGRQPLTATAGITVVVAALASQKASSAVQAWAFALKDALEQAMRYTAMWLNLPATDAPAVRVFTDFDVGLHDEAGPTTLTEARQNGDLSQRTYWAELKRRSILSADFDADAEEEALLAEMPGDDAEQAEVDALAEDTEDLAA